MLRKHIDFMVTIYIKNIKVIEKTSEYFNDMHIIFNIFKCPTCHTGINISEAYYQHYSNEQCFTDT